MLYYYVDYEEAEGHPWLASGPNHLLRITTMFTQHFPESRLQDESESARRAICTDSESHVSDRLAQPTVGRRNLPITPPSAKAGGVYLPPPKRHPCHDMEKTCTGGLYPDRSSARKVASDIIGRD